MSDVLERLLDEEEGNTPFAYPDQKGYLTIARGVCVDRRVPGAGLPQGAIDAANKVRTDEARARAVLLPNFGRLNEVQQAVLISMCFQLGTLHDWPHFRDALAVFDLDAAVQEAMDSDWFRDPVKGTPKRAKRELQMLASGQWVNRT